MENRVVSFIAPEIVNPISAFQNVLLMPCLCKYNLHLTFLVTQLHGSKCQRVQHTLTAQASQGRTRPEKIVGGWLLTCCGMTAGAVVIGGVTRYMVLVNMYSSFD